MDRRAAIATPPKYSRITCPMDRTAWRLHDKKSDNRPPASSAAQVFNYPISNYPITRFLTDCPSLVFRRAQLLHGGDDALRSLLREPSEFFLPYGDGVPVSAGRR